MAAFRGQSFPSTAYQYTNMKLAVWITEDHQKSEKTILWKSFELEKETKYEWVKK